MQTRQQSIGSPFDAASTAMDVMAGIDLSGHRALVTGGYSGIGLATTRQLAQAGARVIVPARDVRRAHAALAGMDGVEVAPMDLMDAASINAFCRNCLDSETSLQILVASAGIMATPLLRDTDGHEAQFSTNHLGHYRLVCGLWPALRAAGGARVVVVSSRGHQIAGVDFDDIDFHRRPYEKWTAYGQSKTANALFALALDQHGAEQGVRAFSLHPGQVLTDLARHLSAEEIASFDVFDDQGLPRVDPAQGLKTIEQGAATSLWCATSPLLDGMGGVYCEDCDIAIINNNQTGQKGVAPWAVDAKLADRLWQLSQAWTRLSLP